MSGGGGTGYGGGGGGGGGSHGSPDIANRLHKAAYHGDVDMVRAMLHSGRENVNSVNGKGNTALVSALIGKGKRKVRIFRV